MLPSVYSTFKEPTFGLVTDQLLSDSQNKIQQKMLDTVLKICLFSSKILE